MKNTNKKIAVDIDDVLLDFHNTIRLWHNKNYGTFLEEGDFNSYFFNEVWGGTIQEAIQKVNEFHYSSEFRNAPPLSGSISAIETLSKEKELFLVTSRPYFVKKETEEWINTFFRDKFSGIFYASNHYSKAKNLGKTKFQICQELGVSMLIDDSPDYIKQCSSKGINGILFGDYPWNRKVILPSRVLRVKNWEEFSQNLTK
jgi:uncharacterized HAD superfamily protein